MGRITDGLKVTNAFKIYPHVGICYTSGMVYQERVVVLAILSCPCSL